MILAKRIKSIEVDKSTIERMPDTIEYAATVSLTYNTWYGRKKTVKCHNTYTIKDGVVMYITESGFELSYDASKKIHDTVQFVKTELDRLNSSQSVGRMKRSGNSSTRVKYIDRRSEFDEYDDDDYGYDAVDLVEDIVDVASDLIEDAIDDYHVRQYEREVEKYNESVDTENYNNQPDTSHTEPVREEYVPEPIPTHTPTYTPEPEPYTPPTRSYESNTDYGSSYDSHSDNSYDSGVYDD